LTAGYLDANVFAKVDDEQCRLKTLLRQAPERTHDGLWRRIGVLLDQFTPSECANYFRAGGYSDSF